MRTLDLALHLFLPHTTNNQKAKLLHSGSLFLLVAAIIFYQLTLELLPALGLRVLGYASNIPTSEVIRLTNERRISQGLSPLTENPILSSAAKAKGEHMLAQDYWAHVAPDGTEPWKFFVDFGYKYRFAGENLARDFSNADSAVEAWMESPTHRDNMLSPKYKEIGIAVVEGDLAGVDTTIIVQFFGTKYADSTTVAPISQTTPSPPLPAIALEATPAPVQSVLISPFTATKTSSLIIVGVLLGILLIDFIVVSKRRIVRIGGRTLAHLSFLGMILAIILIAKAGRIL